MEVVTTCPLGSECETARDGKIYRCAWYTEVRGINPQTGDAINEWKCAHSWSPIIGLENNKVTVSNVAVSEQIRNILSDMAKGV